MSETRFLADYTTKKSCFHENIPGFFGLVENGARCKIKLTILSKCSWEFIPRRLSQLMQDVQDVRLNKPLAE
ncbi:MAG: hypothetical protein WBA41_24160 [Rivularia sp. (in: cyanobacteria)]